ncbi:MAG: hypothetical protein JXK05_04745 [Campylobacterales bacterium]|nr:hypothetical protein [Campylobacterales bacterium]
MPFLVAALLLLLLSGCGDESNQSRPYLYGDSTTEKIDYQAASKIQQTLRDNTQAQELERNATLHQATLQHQSTLSAQAPTRELHTSQSKIHKWWIVAIIAALGIVLFFIYLIMRKRQEFILQQQSEKNTHP